MKIPKPKQDPTVQKQWVNQFKVEFGGNPDETDKFVQYTRHWTQKAILVERSNSEKSQNSFRVTNVQRWRDLGHHPKVGCFWPSIITIITTPKFWKWKMLAAKKPSKQLSGNEKIPSKVLEGNLHPWLALDPKTGCTRAIPRERSTTHAGLTFWRRGTAGISSVPLEILF